MPTSALDVGDPQLVRAAPGDGPVDLVGRDAVGLVPLPLRSARDAAKACAPHQQLDLAVPDRDPVPESEFGVDTATAIDAPRLDVNLGDQIGQPGVPHGPFGRGSLQNVRNSPTPTPREAGRRLGQGSSRRPSPRPPRTAFWARLLPKQLHGTARRLQRSRAQRCALLAAPSSDFSLLVSPGTSPLSIRSWRRQV